jgi:dihydroxy-acid dehydratase
MAGRAGIAFDAGEFDRIGRRTPVIVDLKPIGRGYMEDLHRAGGLPAVMRRLGDRLDLGVITADGRHLGEVLESWPDWVDDAVVRTVDDPVVPGEALAVLRGSLAPGGAILKRAAASDRLLRHEGPALVFDGLDDLARRIDDPDLPVTAEHVLILRGAGPVGGPGMPEAGAVPIPKKLAQAGVKDMVRISDARMSGTAYGTVILHISPEAAIGGPLALVRDGDVVRLDVEARRIDLLVGEDELASRRENWVAPERPGRGYARLYADHVTQAELGCDFDFLRPPAGGVT